MRIDRRWISGSLLVATWAAFAERVSVADGESPPTQDDCCYTSCSCEETTGDELPGTFPPGDPVKAVYTDFAPGAPTGVHAAESVKHDVVLSPATLNGFPSGA